ncbi:MAG: hypothetical protein WCV84_02980 [Patescibacteria group bacterium]
MGDFVAFVALLVGGMHFSDELRAALVFAFRAGEVGLGLFTAWYEQSVAGRLKLWFVATLVLIVALEQTARLFVQYKLGAEIPWYVPTITKYLQWMSAVILIAAFIRTVRTSPVEWARLIASHQHYAALAQGTVPAPVAPADLMTQEELRNAREGKGLSPVRGFLYIMGNLAVHGTWIIVQASILYTDHDLSWFSQAVVQLMGYIAWASVIVVMIAATMALGRSLQGAHGAVNGVLRALLKPLLVGLWGITNDNFNNVVPETTQIPFAAAGEGLESGVKTLFGALLVVMAFTMVVAHYVLVGGIVLVLLVIASVELAVLWLWKKVWNNEATLFIISVVTIAVWRLFQVIVMVAHKRERFTPITVYWNDGLQVINGMLNLPWWPGFIVTVPVLIGAIFAIVKLLPGENVLGKVRNTVAIILIIVLAAVVGGKIVNLSRSEGDPLAFNPAPVSAADMPITCPGSQMVCGGTRCVDTRNDHDNCGACGRVCGATEACNRGTCMACATGQLVCGGNACMDVQSDRNNCGACGNVCRDTETCNEGQCEASALRELAAAAVNAVEQAARNRAAQTAPAPQPTVTPAPAPAPEPAPSSDPPPRRRSSRGAPPSSGTGSTLPSCAEVGDPDDPNSAYRARQRALGACQ